MLIRLLVQKSRALIESELAMIKAKKMWMQLAIVAAIVLYWKEGEMHVYTNKNQLVCRPDGTYIREK
jgi:hypothetical protein